MTLMYECTGDCTGAGVQIFIRTPDGEIDIPIVERERDVADRMRKIEACDDSVFVHCRGDLFDFEQLTREKVHAGKHYYRELIRMFLDKINNVFSSNCKLAFARSCENKGILGIKPVVRNLGL